MEAEGRTGQGREIIESKTEDHEDKCREELEEQRRVGGKGSTESECVTPTVHC